MSNVLPTTGQITINNTAHMSNVMNNVTVKATTDPPPKEGVGVDTAHAAHDYKGVWGMSNVVGEGGC